MVKFNEKHIVMKVKSGAACNIISLQQYLDLGYLKKFKEFKSYYSFTKDRVHIVRKCTLSCFMNGGEYELEFYVTKHDCDNTLGLQSSEECGLIKGLI